MILLFSSTNLIFYVAMPVCGVILLTSTDVVNDPFFGFNATFRLVFSIALGHYTFKTAEVLFFRREVFHYKPLFVHHLVAGTMFVIILRYEQNAILGLVSLFLEGSLIFAELEQEQWNFSVFQKSTKLTKIGTSVAFALAVVLKGVFPATLVAIAFTTSSADLLKMSYVPLAFFFLGLVFFAAVDVWFFKDAFAEVSRQFSKQSPLPIIHLRIPTVPLTTAINHDGLTKLLEINGGLNGPINITQNALWNKDWNLPEAWSPVSLPFEPQVPIENKTTESSQSQKQWTLSM